MRRVILYTTITLLSLFLIISIWDQVNFYNYKKKQFNNYNMLKNRTRKRFVPKIIFDIKYITSYSFNKKYSNKNLGFFLYSDRDNRCETPLSCVGILDSYFMYSYFTEEEINTIVLLTETEKDSILKLTPCTDTIPYETGSVR